MSFIDALRHRVHVLIHRAEYERELDDEIRFHLSADTAWNGDPAGTRRRFGNVTYHREETRRTAGLGAGDALLQDARYMIRSLRHSPGFTAIAILTLAIGIGTTTAIVSVADHVLFRSLPFREPERVMTILERGDSGGFRAPSAPTAADWRADAGAQRAFSRMSFAHVDAAMFRIGDVAQGHNVAYVDTAFFPLLGAAPRLGRSLVADDQRPDAPPVVVLSFYTWQHAFAGDPSAVGRRIDIDGIPTTIVGVMPLGAAFLIGDEAWLPAFRYRSRSMLGRRDVHSDSRALGRLRAGVDSAQAVAPITEVSARLAAAYPVEQARWTPVLFSLRDELVGGFARMLLTLVGASFTVLLLACANVANLLLARAAARARELAVRSALGASRARIIRQLLTESLVLAVASGVLGSLLAAFIVDFARKHLAAGAVPRIGSLVLDQRYLAIAATASLLTALVCGVWPAFHATRPSTGEALRANAFGLAGAGSAPRMRRALVALQFALALMLLVGAGLFVQSFRRAAAVDVGFDPRGVVTLQINPPSGSYTTSGDATALYARLMQAARAVPGTEGAAFINHFPFPGALAATTVHIDNGAVSGGVPPQVAYRTVSETYLQTMKMSLVGGRWFDKSDMQSPGGAFVVNQSMANEYWPGQNAIGKHITLRRASPQRRDFGQPLPGVVIGVVADVHQGRQDRRPDREVYVPYTLESWPWGSLVVRSRDGVQAITALRAAVADVDPRLVDVAKGGQRFESVEAMIESTLYGRRLSMKLVGAFAVCALLLAAIGMYGVVSYGIVQRTRELGMRKALGATDGMIAALLIRETVPVIAAGVLIGSAGAWVTGRLIADLLFNTGAADPAIYGVTIVLLLTIALIATYAPARRVTHVDPVIAMRGD
ncbi:MAG TPA: ABC transporter permease [Gemmatimonadaceae bacterium]|nr:ABC transporter permease [Gemmatimonadaceae bacterium]